jgi:hypothetical protein
METKNIKLLTKELRRAEKELRCYRAGYAATLNILVTDDERMLLYITANGLPRNEIVFNNRVLSSNTIYDYSINKDYSHKFTYKEIKELANEINNEWKENKIKEYE